MKLAGIPSQIMSYPQEVRIEKLTGLATLGFEPGSSRIHVRTRETYQMSYCDLRQHECMKQDANPIALTGILTRDRLVSTSRDRNVPDELPRIYDNMNA
ncbi:unnamed protein product [Sphenostylis stenocarpa]|uniref:Uncharacterized protein n=1 Tax=Sphenostylis stenocarpa TaxID=92480 RepID=A0AA86S1K0_9FABA|nr:unnamed protein product [Sphenostylis stenocarpa]